MTADEEKFLVDSNKLLRQKLKDIQSLLLKLQVEV